MNKCLVDYPVYYSKEDYSLTISTLINKLKNINDVISIYQIGNISEPGISDIDILVIFKDNYKNDINPLRDCNKRERYLLCHNLFGMTQSNFNQSQRFSFFHNYNHLHGLKLNIGNSFDSATNHLIKHQIALEYILQFFISFSVQKEYGIYRTRNIMLTAKALMYDLEFLGIISCEFYNLVYQLITIRKNWFDNENNVKKFDSWLDNFDVALCDFVKKIFHEKKIYFPKKSSLKISRHVSLYHSDIFKYYHRGFVLPNKLSFLGKKYFNIQNRFNKFNIGLPYLNEDIPQILVKRFVHMSQIRKYNVKNLPYFMPLASSLGFN